MRERVAVAIGEQYELHDEIGRGGMAVVYRGRDVRLRRAVAIKVLPPEFAFREDIRSRFLREAQMAAQLSHPNIVPIHHVDEAGEFVFFVMAFIDGETLGERLRTRGPLSPLEGARIFRDVGWALAYAHLRGIVHRDVKPDNILLERATGRALVTDFGIAGDVQTASNADGQYIRGTVHFLSPEQAAGAPVDGRSDLYSLGVTAYYGLTGKLPFDAPTATAVMVAHATRRARPIVEQASHVPHKLADAIERCLEKRPEFRWENGERFAEAVDAAIEAPKELPAPLRAWVSGGERARGGMVVVGIYGSAAVFGLMMSGQMAIALLVLVLVTSLVMLPTLTAIRRLVSGGFSIADIRNAVATHAQRRREEMEYEFGASFALNPKRLGIISGLCATGSLLGFGSVALGLAAKGGPAMALGVLMGALSVMTGLVSLLRLAQMGKLKGVRNLRIAFWNGKWGDRLYRLGAWGMKAPVASATVLPQHTEVALGRALDAIFESLPRATRKELKAVPQTVRRLEEEARKLREALDAVDAAQSAAERAEQPDAARELAKDHERLSERLASTVTALETIRLGLLRLQIGAGPVSSVTEAIEAASALEHELDIAAEARREASAVIKPLKR